MTATLVALAGPLCGESFRLEEADTTIGRDSTVEVSIPDHLMSRRHCLLRAAGGGFTLLDLGSSNGTFVNGIPAHARDLQHGDRIRAGDSVLLFLQPGTATRPAGAIAMPGAGDDRTARLPHRPGGEETPGGLPAAIVAEVLAGRMTLDAHDMVGDSGEMRAVYERIRRVAPSNCSVLVSGETGTGKELAARAIHQNSPRARGPFIAVNCAALTESLLESELFGHERGAFTGAVALKRGKFEIADGGTVFLDEVGELAPALQAKLLRALQHHAFERVGGTRTLAVDVRVVAASNRDLAGDVAAGRFRQDLWYRLNVVSVTMPPLRARRDDIALLAGHFAARYGRNRRIAIAREALDAMRAYDWPGNVRELENVIQAAVVLGCSDTIVADDLPEAVLGRSAQLRGEPAAAYHQKVLETKRRLIVEALDRSGGNYTAAAKILGINPTYLHRLATNLQIRDLASRR
jgi:transcriptional regulator with GAF, ATPase, and Fis domain